MKPVNISLATISFSIIFFILYFGLASCKKISDTRINSNAKDTITYELIKTNIYVQFVDANTNEPIIPTDGNEFTVEIVGKSRAAVIDVVGLQKEKYVPKQGFLTFGLLSDAEFVPSAVSPVVFTIITSLSGYLTSVKNVTLTNEGDYIVTVTMVNTTDLPPGVVIKKSYNVGVLINGVVQDDIITTTPNNEVIFTIPAGTKLINQDSNYLAGKLNITLAYFNGLDDKALAAIPGGVAGNIIENSSIFSGMFFHAGVLSYEIYDSDWKKATIIEGDSLQISMSLSSQNYNPITGSNVVGGDLISVYSYLSDTGLWLLNEAVYITDALSGGLFATIKTQELGYSNFSWFEKNSCNQGSGFQLSGSCAQCGSVMLEGIVRKQADNTFVSDIKLAGLSNESFYISFSTGDTPVFIDWTQSNECNYCYVSPAVNPLLIDDMCSQAMVELPLVDDGPLTMSITANFSGICQNDTNVIILPSFGLWIRPINATCWRWTSMKVGVAQICNVVYGETYILGTYYDGNWKEWQVTISEEINYDFDITFSSSVCTNVLGIL